MGFESCCLKMLISVSGCAARRLAVHVPAPQGPGLPQVKSLRGKLELWGDDPDKSPTPALINWHEVQQRGVAGTKEILQGIIDGSELPVHAPVIVADLMPSQPP